MRRAEELWMSDFERSGMTYDEPVKRRSPGTWFADLGDRLARGRVGYEQHPGDEPDWDAYGEPDETPATAKRVRPSAFANSRTSLGQSAIR